jgi:hypothetical protein
MVASRKAADASVESPEMLARVPRSALWSGSRHLSCKKVKRVSVPGETLLEFRIEQPASLPVSV